ncbi:hypothetical protein GWK48_02735 [Metallosphaera tengchongensis]|uniref:Uncharacterized protein n=1 Tax=Metallosphaera tengchongensis TaxID=1532350 RepID=A0A6N0NRW4_9CREN|nr:hypothetical protein [Metallosphaera tengchongensis]QKQ99451.1 hypothetical protein GWK48_02735 [Metallosphaera tengchongensis]
MRGSLIIALGIALLSLSAVSITQHVTMNQVLVKPFSILVPSTAQGEIQVEENASNVTVYVEVIHNGVGSVEPLPLVLPLSQGNWTLIPYSETYAEVVSKVVNQTEQLKCGNVTVQKVVNQTVEKVSGKVNVPIYVKIDIYRMRLVVNPELVGGVGVGALIVGGILLSGEKVLKH